MLINEDFNSLPATSAIPRKNDRHPEGHQNVQMRNRNHEIMPKNLSMTQQLPAANHNLLSDGHGGEKEERDQVATEMKNHTKSKNSRYTMYYGHEGKTVDEAQPQPPQLDGNARR